MRVNHRACLRGAGWMDLALSAWLDSGKGVWVQHLGAHMSEPGARLRIPGGNHCLRKFSQIGTPIRLWQKCDEKIYIDNRFDGHDLDLIGRQHAGFQDEQGENHQNHNGPVYGLHANNMRRESPVFQSGNSATIKLTHYPGQGGLPFSLGRWLPSSRSRGTMEPAWSPITSGGTISTAEQLRRIRPSGTDTAEGPWLSR